MSFQNSGKLGKLSAGASLTASRDEDEIRGILTMGFIDTGTEIYP